MKGAVSKVVLADLFVSEPPAHFFGNSSAREAHWTEKNWLKSRFHFAFAEWEDGPSNFGALRVVNDDLVQSNRGFGTHPHQNMEIVTIVLKGELTHKDSMGNSETLTRGSVQYMSAGTGVRHSEGNHHPNEPLRFIQTWLLPRSRGSKPRYGSYQPTEALPSNEWVPLVGDLSNPGSKPPPVLVDQDTKYFWYHWTEGRQPFTFPVAAGRQAYVLLAEGSTVDLIEGEAWKAVGDTHVNIAPTTSEGLVIAIEVKQ